MGTIKRVHLELFFFKFQWTTESFKNVQYYFFFFKLFIYIFFNFIEVFKNYTV